MGNSTELWEEKISGIEKLRKYKLIERIKKINGHMFMRLLCLKW